MATNNKHHLYSILQDENRANSMVTAMTNRLLAMRNESLNESLSDFEGSEHKLEFVKTIEGVDFINDSRSTNANSVWFALESMNKPTCWITNISDLDSMTQDLLDILDEKVRRIVIQGVYNSAVLDFFKGLQKEVAFAMNLEEAVRTAFYLCKSGDVILFSPGTTSAGMFRTYRERGDKFKEAVAQL